MPESLYGMASMDRLGDIGMALSNELTGHMARYRRVLENRHGLMDLYCNSTNHFRESSRIDIKTGGIVGGVALSLKYEAPDVFGYISSAYRLITVRGPNDKLLSTLTPSDTPVTPYDLNTLYVAWGGQERYVAAMKLTCIEIINEVVINMLRSDVRVPMGIVPGGHTLLTDEFAQVIEYAFSQSLAASICTRIAATTVMDSL